MFENNNEYFKQEADRKVAQYIKEIIQPHFPNYSTAITSMWGDYPQSATLSISPFGKVLKGSQFYYSENNTFIHFTNINNAKNIIADGGIYLSGLNTSDDNNEINLNLKSFDQYTNPYLNHVMIKEDFLNLSMSPFAMERSFLNGNFDSIFHNFKEFGNGQPIGLVLELDFENRDDWFKYHLSKVYYSEENNASPTFLNKLVKETESWCRLNSFEILELHNAFYSLLAFHKENKFKMENEVRLIKAPIDITDTNFSYQKPIPSIQGYFINSKNAIVQFEKLYFEGYKKEKIMNFLFNDNHTSKEIYLKQTPKIKLQKILIPTHNPKCKELNETISLLLRKLEMDTDVKHLEFCTFNKEISIF